MSIQFGSGAIWFCSKEMIGCDVIPYEFFYVSIAIIIVSFWIGFFISKFAKRSKNE